MVVGNHGQVVFYAIMLGIVVIVLALALAFPIKQAIENSRNEMNCTNTTADGTINNYNQGACMTMDLTLSFFIIGLIIFGLIIIGAKIVFT